jgi:hypothetical protein
LTSEGLVIEERMELKANTNCYQMVVVEVQGSREVWGTLDRNQLVMLKRHGRGGWMMDGPYQVQYEHSRPEWQFFCIAHAAFQDKAGMPQNHLWASYRQKRTTICWDLQKRQYKAMCSTDSFTKCESSKSAQVTVVATSGKKVLVGTDIGSVGIIDSETCQVLHCLQWHTSKVRSLLLMPKEMEPCVCAEIPLPEFHREDSVGTTKLLARAPTRTLVHQRTLSDSDMISLTDVNPSVVVDTGMEGSMVASIGNGRGGGVIEVDPDKKNVTLLLWRC